MLQAKFHFSSYSVKLCRLFRHDSEYRFARDETNMYHIEFIESFYLKYGIYKPREVKNHIKKRVRKYITCILLELLAQIKKILRYAMWQN